MSLKPRNGREARSALVAKTRARLQDPRHDEVAALTAVRAALGKPLGPKRNRRGMALHRLPRATQRHAATLKLDADAKRRCVAVGKARGVDWHDVPVRYTIPKVATGTIRVTVAGDARPCGTAGWYAEGQTRGRLSAESPLARALREAEEQYLFGVGKLQQVPPKSGKELAEHSAEARRNDPKSKGNRMRANMEAERVKGTSESSLAKVAAEVEGASRRHAQRVKRTLPARVSATPSATLRPARASARSK